MADGDDEQGIAVAPQIIVVCGNGRGEGTVSKHSALEICPHCGNQKGSGTGKCNFQTKPIP